MAKKKEVSKKYFLFLSIEKRYFKHFLSHIGRQN